MTEPFETLASSHAEVSLGAEEIQEAQIALALADASGDSRFGIETLQFIPGLFDKPITSGRFPYDAALEAHRKQLEGKWQSSDGDWSIYYDQHTDEFAIACDTLRAQGADPQWVASHVYPDLATVRNSLPAKHQDHKIVPLAQAPAGTLAGETIDGDPRTTQRVYLGVTQ